MTKQFHVDDCPDCRFNQDDFACSNSLVACRPSEWERQNKPIAGFTVFEGRTTRRCHRKEEKERLKTKP